MMTTCGLIAGVGDWFEGNGPGRKTVEIVRIGWKKAECIVFLRHGKKVQWISLKRLRTAYTLESHRRERPSA